LLSNSALSSDKGILASGCVGDTTTDNAPCVAAGTNLKLFSSTTATQGAKCTSAEYNSLDIFISFKSTWLKGSPIGYDCSIGTDYPSADCAKYGTDKDKTISFCAAECIKLKEVYTTDKATGANCLGFQVLRNKADRTTYTC
jgi:hypothetical protein